MEKLQPASPAKVVTTNPLRVSLATSVVATFRATLHVAPSDPAGVEAP